jgi:spectinomycin phosphotransferase
MEALADLDRAWQGGPYAERARLLLSGSRSRIEIMLQAYDRVAEAVEASTDSWVVTHGEPHSANFLTLLDGEMRLIDWDTVQLAPRERDLWIVVGDDEAALASYQREVGAYTPDQRAMELFRVRWLLADISVYVRGFRDTHGDSFDEQLSWKELQECVRDTVERPLRTL